MATEHTFDEEKVEATIEAARAHYAHKLAKAPAIAEPVTAEGPLSLLAECISVTVEDGKICLKVPVAGSICIPIPVQFPNGTAAQACLHICSKFGIPTGVCVTVTILGSQVARQCFGLC